MAYFLRLEAVVDNTISLWVTESGFCCDSWERMQISVDAYVLYFHKGGTIAVVTTIEVKWTHANS